MELEMRRAVIISGAPNPDIDFIKKQMKESDFIITADAGLLVTRTLGLCADVAVGDFDSCCPKLEDAKEIVRLPAEKDWTDTAVACQEAVRRGFQKAALYNVVGSRVDHTYSNFLCLNYFLENRVEAALYHLNTRAFLTEKAVSLQKNGYQYFSLFAFAGPVHGLTLTGVKYPLKNYCLNPESNLAVSNEITEDAASISIAGGKLLIIQSND